MQVCGCRDTLGTREAECSCFQRRVPAAALVEVARRCERGYHKILDIDFIGASAGRFTQECFNFNFRVPSASSIERIIVCDISWRTQDKNVAITGVNVMR